MTMPDQRLTMDPNPATAATTRGSTVALTATLGLAAAAWVVAVRQMTGMDMGVATELGSFGFFAAAWVSMMAAMMLPGAGGAAVPGRLPRRLGPRRPAGIRGVPAARVARGRRGRARGWVLRAHAAQAALPPALPREHPLRTRVRPLLRRLEHRTNADAGGAGRHEPRLDVDHRGRRPRPEAAARQGRDRRAGRGGDPRTRDLDHPRARVGSRTHPIDVTQEGKTMTDHKTGTRQEWLAARLELLAAEKELTRRGDELARMRQELPWVRLDKEYVLDTDEGAASLADLFRGRSQLLVYHFMFGPDYTAGCPACSAIADGFNGFVTHLAHHDVMLWAVSRAPLAKLQAYKQRMRWSFPWASSYGSDFNAQGKL